MQSTVPPISSCFLKYYFIFRGRIWFPQLRGLSKAVGKAPGMDLRRGASRRPDDGIPRSAPGVTPSRLLSRHHFKVGHPPHPRGRMEGGCVFLAAGRFFFIQLKTSVKIIFLHPLFQKPPGARIPDLPPPSLGGVPPPPLHGDEAYPSKHGVWAGPRSGVWVQTQECEWGVRAEPQRPARARGSDQESSSGAFSGALEWQE